MSRRSARSAVRARPARPRGGDRPRSPPSAARSTRRPAAAGRPADTRARGSRPAPGQRGSASGTATRSTLVDGGLAGHRVRLVGAGDHDLHPVSDRNLVRDRRQGDDDVLRGPRRQPGSRRPGATPSPAARRCQARRQHGSPRRPLDPAGRVRTEVPERGEQRGGRLDEVTRGDAPAAADQRRAARSRGSVVKVADWPGSTPRRVRRRRWPGVGEAPPVPGRLVSAAGVPPGGEIIGLPLPRRGRAVRVSSAGAPRPG